MSYSKTKAAVSAVLGIASVWAPAQAVWAQAATPEADTLQEVIITAERRATDVQTTPLAVTAISGDEMVAKQIVNIQALTATAPSLTLFDRGGGYTAINIRGIGNSAIVPSVASGVAVVRDGAYLPEPIGHNVPFFDIADTEVLRGPQGTFIGASSTGGALLINSQNPKLDGNTSGFITAQVGDYSQQKLQGAINLPMSDTFAARVAFNTEQRNSFYRQTGTIVTGAPTTPQSDPGNVNDRNVRIGLLWKPNEKLDVLFKFEDNQSRNDGLPAQPNNVGWNPLINTAAGQCYLQPYVVAAGSANQVLCPAAPSTLVQHGPYWSASGAYNTNPYTLNYDVAQTKFNQTQQAYTLDTHYTADGGTVLRSVTAFRHIHVWDTSDRDLTSAQTGRSDHEIGPQNNYYSEELSLASPTEQRVSWIVGAFGFYRDTVVRSYGYQYNVGANGQALGFDGASYSSYAGAATATPLVANAPITQLVGGLPLVTGYVPGLIQNNGMQISNLSVGSTGAVQRMAAAFGKVTIKLNDQLDLEVGARENWDANFGYANNFQVGTYRFSYVRNATTGKLDQYITRLNCVQGNGANTTQALNYGGNCLDSRASVGNKDSVPTYKVGLNYKPQDGQFLYLFYAHGFKSNGINNQQNAANLRFFDVEKVDDFEAGWKSKFWNNRVQLSVGAYYMKDKGMQYPIYDPTTNAANVVGNMGDSTLSGLEISLDARVKGWSFSGGLAYSKSKLGNVNQVPTYLLGTITSGVTAQTAQGSGVNVATPGLVQCAANLAPGSYCFNYTPYAVNISGESNPMAPQITANLQVSYDIEVGDGTLRPRVAFSHSDKQYASIFQANDVFLMGARNLFNVNVDYERAAWTASAFMTNVTNQTYLTDGSSTSSVYYGAPRQVGLRVSRKF